MLGNPYLRSIAACTGASNLFSNIALRDPHPLRRPERGAGAAAIGIVFAIGASGVLVGALVANRLATRFGVGPTIVVTAFLGFPAALLVAAAPPALAIPCLIGGVRRSTGSPRRSTTSTR